MWWIPLVLAPIALGVVIALGKLTLRSTSFLLAVLGLAVFQVVLLIFALNDWNPNEIAPVLLFGVLAPWVIVAGLVRTIPPTKQRVFASIGLPITYLVLVAVGLGIADMLGMLRH